MGRGTAVPLWLRRSVAPWWRGGLLGLGRPDLGPPQRSHLSRGPPSSCPMSGVRCNRGGGVVGGVMEESPQPGPAVPYARLTRGKQTGEGARANLGLASALPPPSSDPSMATAHHGHTQRGDANKKLKFDLKLSTLARKDGFFDAAVLFQKSNHLRNASFPRLWQNKRNYSEERIVVIRFCLNPVELF